MNVKVTYSSNRFTMFSKDATTIKITSESTAISIVEIWSGNIKLIKFKATALTARSIFALFRTIENIDDSYSESTRSSNCIDLNKFDIMMMED